VRGVAKRPRRCRPPTVGVPHAHNSGHVLGIPRLLEVLRAFNRRKPAEPPPHYPASPLSFVGFALIHSRWVGGLLIAGLVLNALVPIRLPWL